MEQATEIASNIASRDHALLMQAAPDLLEFATAIWMMGRQAGAEGKPDPVTITAFCRAMLPRLQGTVAGRTRGPLKRKMAPKTTAESGRKRSTAELPAPFDQTFREVLDYILAEARRRDISLKSLAEERGISRAQFARWRKSPPSVIRVMTDLQTSLLEK